MGVHGIDLSPVDLEFLDSLTSKPCFRFGEGVEGVPGGSAYVAGRGLRRAERRRGVVEERWEECEGRAALTRDDVPPEVVMVAMGAIGRIGGGVRQREDQTASLCARAV